MAEDKPTMTPKQAYEYRKAVRKEQREAGGGHRMQSDRDDEFIDIMDRFVTAVERIADAMEADHG